MVAAGNADEGNANEGIGEEGKADAIHLFELFRHFPPHSSHSSRPTRKVTPPQQLVEAEGNADAGYEDEGNPNEGNVDKMYFFVFCCTSPIICLIHLICLRPTSKVTPQEQPMEGEGNSFDEDNDDEMYLFADDESEYVEAELDEDSESTEETEEPPPKRNFISIRRKIEIAEAAVRGRSIPGFTLRGLARDNNLQGIQNQGQGSRSSPTRSSSVKVN